jgi:hypothetical protein
MKPCCDDVVVADRIGQKVLRIAWIEVEDQLRAAKVGSGLVTDEFTFGDVASGQVAR